MLPSRTEGKAKVDYEWHVVDDTSQLIPHGGLTLILGSVVMQWSTMSPLRMKVLSLNPSPDMSVSVFLPLTR